MKILKQRLAAAARRVSEAHSDFEYDDVSGSGTRKRRLHHGLSVREFASIYASQRHRAGSKRADSHVPDGVMLPLVAEVRNALEGFIDPESDRLGHAFPIDRYGSIRNSGGEAGVSNLEFESTPENFTESLLQAAAIMGIDKATELLGDWKCEEPIRFKTSTLVNGLVLDARYALRDNIEIVALPLTTAELPRLPDRSRGSPQDYLGKTLLSLKMSASPALFRPKTDSDEATVLTHTDKNIDFDTVCDALSLQANSPVSKTFLWTEHAEAAPFSLSDWVTSGYDTLDHLCWKSKSLDSEKGIVSIERQDNVSIASLDETELLQLINALPGGDRKLRIAVDRWKRSMRPTYPITDRFIDLRIALETPYLKEFPNERSTEMRFRLSLFGAWHLGTMLEERRDIRKVLRDAYDKASGAVHGGEVSDGSESTLAQAQDLCRQGILKLLREGPPDDWGDLILGASF